MLALDFGVCEINSIREESDSARTLSSYLFEHCEIVAFAYPQYGSYSFSRPFIRKNSGKERSSFLSAKDFLLQWQRSG